MDLTSFEVIEVKKRRAKLDLKIDSGMWIGSWSAQISSFCLDTKCLKRSRKLVTMYRLIGSTSRQPAISKRKVTETEMVTLMQRMERKTVHEDLQRRQIRKKISITQRAAPCLLRSKLAAWRQKHHKSKYLQQDDTCAYCRKKSGNDLEHCKQFRWSNQNCGERPPSRNTGIQS